MLFCGQFSIIVNAGSDNNLINPDLTQWKDLGNYESNSYPIAVTKGGNVFRLTLQNQDYPMYFGAVLDDTSLVAGHSYSLIFKLPNQTECNNAFGNSYSLSVYENHFKNSEIRVGIGFLSSSGTFETTEDNILYTITKDNYTNFFGKTLNASFIASSFKGTPCVFFQILSLDGGNHTFYVSDFMLVDNDDNSAELKGIKGFLHSIRWDLVGGICDEEDCPHSLAGNPHLSLSERMSAGFSSMFAEIGNKFENGSTLNIWFNGLSDKVVSINGSLTGLGDRISGFFNGLGDRISGFFTDLKTNMASWFTELGNKITTKFQEIGDKFTEFFEKFKPRVTINFDWQQGYVNASTGKILIDYYEDGHFFELGKGYCVITDFFEIPSDCQYQIDFNNRYMSSLSILKYDLNGTFIGKVSSPSSSFEGFSLDSGYKYIFMLYFTKDYPSDSDMNDFCNSFLSVYADEGWINALLYNIKISIKGLFVPREMFMEEYSNSWHELISTRFGAVAEVSGVLYDFFDSIVAYSGSEQNTISVPAVTLPLPDNASYTFGGFDVEIVNEKFIFLQNAVKVLAGILATFSFVYGLRKRYDEVMGVEH